MHTEPDVAARTTTVPEPYVESPGSASSAARISTGVVRLTAKYSGRGPTRARTTITPTFAAVVLEDVLTKAERWLVAAGELRHVREHRDHLHRLMRDEVVALVEEQTGRRALGCLSDTCPEAGIVVHTVMLRPGPEAA